MRRRISSYPLTALALLLLLCLSRSVAAARLLPLQQRPAGVRPLAPHQEDNGVKETAADGLVIQEDEAEGYDGDELYISEMTGEEAEQAVACEEGNEDECLPRRLLRSDYSPAGRHRPPNS